MSKILEFILSVLRWFTGNSKLSQEDIVVDNEAPDVNTKIPESDETPIKENEKANTMRESVRNAFVPFTSKLEGVVPWMYPDVKGLVSTGIGNLIDPISLALSLPWKRPDGSLASQDEIIEDWNTVKNFPDAPRLGHKSVENIAKLRLTSDDINNLVLGKLASNEKFLMSHYPDYVNWPADAQLGLLSMSWAVGPAFFQSFKRMDNALKQRDFRTAATESFLPEEKTISGLHPRNVANRILFNNAAVVQKGSLDHDTLFYPKDLLGSLPPESKSISSGTVGSILIALTAGAYWFTRNKL